MYHVALFVETSRAYGRGLIDGVARYNNEHAGWSIHFQPYALEDPLPPWLKNWHGNGIIARIDNLRAAEAVLAAGAPVVDLRGTMSKLNLPFVGANNEAVAQMGADHLLERSLTHFGFCGLARGINPGLDRRADHFHRLIEEAGFNCSMFEKAGFHCSMLTGRHRRRASNWEKEQGELAHWIASLPKPVGIMTCNDDRGMQVLDACRRLGALVPEQVAVLGVDNDEHLCGLSIPPLSSIDINSEEVGWQAAKLLDQLMAGRKAPKVLQEVIPRGVVTRRSTDVLSTDDQDVVRAVRFIRENAFGRLLARDVLAHVSVSRASLEPRIFQVIHRTIHQEIERVRVERAKELLATTNLEIKQVAQQAGFRCVSYMTRVFRRVLDETPAHYRARLRH